MNDKSIGIKLREAREARGLTIPEVAQQLLLSKKSLTALENDDYSAIPALAYVRGYLRSYARFLKLPVEELLAEVAVNDVGITKGVSAEFLQAEAQEYKRMQYVRWTVYSILVLFVILIVFWIYDVRQSSKITEDIIAPSISEQPVNLIGV